MNSEDLFNEFMLSYRNGLPISDEFANNVLVYARTLKDNSISAKNKFRKEGGNVFLSSCYFEMIHLLGTKAGDVSYALEMRKESLPARVLSLIQYCNITEKVFEDILITNKETKYV